MPGTVDNPVNVRANGVIPVAVLSTSRAQGESIDFDAGQVDPWTVVFGPNGAMPKHPGGHLEDIDFDGDLDLVVHFERAATGIACGQTQASLDASTFSGSAVTGTDSIRVIGGCD